MPLDWINPDPHNVAYWQAIADGLASRRIAAPAAPAARAVCTAAYMHDLASALRQSVDSATWQRADHATLTWRDVCEEADLDLDLPAAGWPVANAATLLAGLARAIPLLRRREGAIEAGAGCWVRTSSTPISYPASTTSAAAIADMHASGLIAYDGGVSAAPRVASLSRAGGNLVVSDYTCGGEIRAISPCPWAAPMSAEVLAEACGATYDAWGTGLAEGWTELPDPGVRETVVYPAASTPGAPDHDPAAGTGGTYCMYVTRAIYDYGAALVWPRATT